MSIKSKPLPEAVTPGYELSPASKSHETKEEGDGNKPLLDVQDTEGTLISASGTGSTDNKSDVETGNDDTKAQGCRGRLRDVFIWTGQQFFGRIIREMATDVWNSIWVCCSELMEDEC